MNIKKSLLVLGLAMGAVGAAQAEDTLAKIKNSGSITLGVRESSGVLSYTLGGSKYVGYHVAICEQAVEAIEKQVGKKLEVKYQPVTSQNRIPWCRTARWTWSAAPPPTTPRARRTWPSR